MSENIKDASVNSATVFKPELINITLGDETYSLVFDMNAFCELEKRYSTIDAVIRKILGRTSKEHKVMLINGDNKTTVDADNITVDGNPLSNILAERDATRDTSCTTADTLDILYCGLMRDLAIYNEHDEIVGYKKSKREIGSLITFRNLKDVNIKLAIAFMQDLVPTVAETKNAMGAEATQEEPQGLHYSAE